MQKRKILLVSAIIGVVFVGLWVWGFIALMKSIDVTLGGFSNGVIQGLKEILANFGGMDSDGKLGLFLFIYGVFALPILLVTATALNFIGWAKVERKKCLVTGILYVVSLNFPSAMLCFVEYADMANPIKKKSLLISLILGILAALPWLVCVIFLGDESRSLFITFFTITLAAVIINLFAWKTGKGAVSLVSAVLYMAGGLSIISAIICYIDYAKAKDIKNKSMFTSLALGILAALAWLALVLYEPSANDDGSRIIFIVFLIITLVAAALNYFAWTKEKKALILASAIVYTIGGFSIVSAIICYVNRALYAKKHKKTEELH
jgi:uncharacterized membrane protein